LSLLGWFVGLYYIIIPYFYLDWKKEMEKKKIKCEEKRMREK